MNTERLIHMPQCSAIDLSALCNCSNSIWKTIESHRWVKLSCENIGMCCLMSLLRWLYGSLIVGILYRYDMITKCFHLNEIMIINIFLYIIVSWYLLGIITRQGFLFSCSCMNGCTCQTVGQHTHIYCIPPWLFTSDNHGSLLTISDLSPVFESVFNVTSNLWCTIVPETGMWTPVTKC